MECKYFWIWQVIHSLPLIWTQVPLGRVFDKQTKLPSIKKAEMETLCFRKDSFHCHN